MCNKHRICCSNHWPQLQSVGDRSGMRREHYIINKWPLHIERPGFVKCIKSVDIRPSTSVGKNNMFLLLVVGTNFCTTLVLFSFFPMHCCYLVGLEVYK